MTNDIRTPDSHESKELRDSLLQHIDEITLQQRNLDRFKFCEWLKNWINQETIKSRKAGYRQIVLKHPLTAFFINEIQEICRPKWVVITRSFKSIEETRQRRRWLANYGQAGASEIYSRIFSALSNSGLSAMCVSYEEFCQRLEVREALINWLELTPNIEQREMAEKWIK